MAELLIRDGVAIPEAELNVSCVRSSGPGGQNVNKVNSKVELRFRLGQSSALPPAVHERMMTRYASQLTQLGELVVVGDRFRSQLLNLKDVRDRLRLMVLAVWDAPKRRRPTKPSQGAQRRRLEAKRVRGALKRERGRSPLE